MTTDELKEELERGGVDVASFQERLVKDIEEKIKQSGSSPRLDFGKKDLLDAIDQLKGFETPRTGAPSVGKQKRYIIIRKERPFDASCDTYVLHSTKKYKSKKKALAYIYENKHTFLGYYARVLSIESGEDPQTAFDNQLKQGLL